MAFSSKFRQANFSLSKFPFFGIIFLILFILFLPAIKNIAGNFSSFFGNLRGFAGSLTDFFGITKNEVVENIKKEASSNVSPFSPDFYKKAPAGSLLVTISFADDFILNIKSCFGFFYDDFSKCLSYFKQLKTQSQVSFICSRFFDTDKGDFLTYLLGESFPQDRFSSTEVQTLVDFVYKLPKYNV